MTLKTHLSEIRTLWPAIPQRRNRKGGSNPLHKLPFHSSKVTYSTILLQI